MNSAKSKLARQVAKAEIKQAQLERPFWATRSTLWLRILFLFAPKYKARLDQKAYAAFLRNQKIIEQRLAEEAKRGLRGKEILSAEAQAAKGIH